MNEIERKKEMYNGSGYYDGTAYLAIRSADAPKAGDIWIDERGREYLLIAVHGSCATCLMLETVKKPESIQIIARDIRYTTPYMLTYRFTEKLYDFVKMIKTNELNDVRKAVSDSIGLEFTPNDQSAKIQLMEDELAEWKEAYRNATATAEQLKKQLKEQPEKQEAKTDGIPWEKMYNDLLDKLIAGRM